MVGIMYKQKERILMNRISSFFRLAIVSATISTVALAASTLSYADSTTIPVDLAGANTSKYEIAVLQVLSEICPPILDKNQRSGFFKAYDYELKKQLPTIDNPKAAIQYLSTQQDYKSILTSMRSWTMGFPQEDNKALCTDLANASF